MSELTGREQAVRRVSDANERSEGGTPAAEATAGGPTMGETVESDADADGVLGTLREALTTLRENSGVETVYGDPIERDGRTVVPAAKVAYGFGGGFGTGGTDEDGSGGGGGGGVAASPLGALEVTDDGTRFVRFQDRRRTLALALVAAAVGYLLGRR
jgi:uncharacterized spore protein YtfJ